MKHDRKSKLMGTRHMDTYFVKSITQKGRQKCQGLVGAFFHAVEVKLSWI